MGQLSRDMLPHLVWSPISHRGLPWAEPFNLHESTLPSDPLESPGLTPAYGFRLAHTTALTPRVPPPTGVTNQDGPRASSSAIRDKDSTRTGRAGPIPSFNRSRTGRDEPRGPSIVCNPAREVYPADPRGGVPSRSRRAKESTRPDLRKFWTEPRQDPPRYPSRTPALGINRAQPQDVGTQAFLPRQGTAPHPVVS